MNLMSLDRWQVVTATFALSLAWLAAVAFWLFQLERQNDELTRRSATASQRAARAAAAAAPAPASAPLDFTAQLPERPDMTGLLADMERVCAQAGVSLMSMQLQDRSASQQQLGLTTIVVHLRGNYPAVKQSLIDIQAKHRFVTVQSLRFQASAGTSGAARSDEAWVSLSVWSRPPQPAPALRSAV